MKRTFLLTLACAVGIAAFGEASPSSAAPMTPSRAGIRADAMASLNSGDIQEVANHRVQRKRYRTSRPYSLRSVHSRGRWCGKGRWYGKRCYYTPSGLRPFRQH